ncbi:hypothetical protein ACFWHR_13410 [Leucobacter sp. NPDC058333]|uniref:hypothetical protein n=1 Tax=Leucobacter sp. NPDC058333 TaxID=3346450 RepID=UPI00366708C3
MIDTAPAARKYPSANHVRFGRFLAVTETVNQERALTRLLAGVEQPIHVETPDEQHREALLQDPAIDEAISRFTSALHGRVSEAVVKSFENQVYKVAVALHRYRLMDLSGFAGILVSTQHSPIIRALCVAAREQSVAVVYVPHAPAAINNAYLDLPVHYVGLRGAGERAYYETELGVAPSDLRVVGNLSSDILDAPSPAIEPTGPGVLALSPHSDKIMRRIFDAVGASGLGPMTIAPHPRSDIRQIRDFMPTDWSLFTGARTLDLLLEGPAFVLQFSSGVAWESAALGIPTATIRLDRSPVNYPFLADEQVYPSLFAPEDTRRFVSAARSENIDRAALRKHAIQWCAVDGPEAMYRLFDLLDEVALTSDAGQLPYLHDGWSAGGAAISRSWLASTEVSPH